MKTSKTFLLIIFLVTVFISCSDDDSTTSDPAPIDLTINQETAQDQMGDFACNAIALHNGKVWSVGGVNSYSSPNFNGDVWSSTNGKAWVSVSNNIVGERCGHTLTTFNSELWLIGGENNAGDWYGDIWHSSDGSTWSNIFLTAPFGNVAYHNTVVFNGKMYVIAADSDTGNTKVWSTTNGNDWIQVTANAFPARVSQKTVVFNGAMYVIGGENTASTKLNEIYTSTNGSTWTLVTNNASVFPGINGHSATVYNNKVWIVGGRTNASAYTNDIYYSDNLQDWTKYAGFNPIDPIVVHSTLLYNDAIWVFGGYVGFETVTGNIWSIKED